VPAVVERAGGAPSTESVSLAEDEISLEAHIALVEELPHRIATMVAAGVLTSSEAQDVVSQARLLLQARVAIGSAARARS
jgi:hypothetical protein